MIEQFTGPAFPFSFEVDGEQRWAHGMTLRDYAAIELAKSFVRYEEDLDAIATKAYAMADALARAGSVENPK